MGEQEPKEEPLPQRCIDAKDDGQDGNWSETLNLKGKFADLKKFMKTDEKPAMAEKFISTSETSETGNTRPIFGGVKTKLLASDIDKLSKASLDFAKQSTINLNTRHHPKKSSYSNAKSLFQKDGVIVHKKMSASGGSNHKEIYRTFVRDLRTKGSADGTTLFAPIFRSIKENLRRVIINGSRETGFTLFMSYNEGNFVYSPLSLALLSSVIMELSADTNSLKDSVMLAPACCAEWMDAFLDCMTDFTSHVDRMLDGEVFDKHNFSSGDTAEGWFAPVRHHSKTTFFISAPLFSESERELLDKDPADIDMLETETSFYHLSSVAQRLKYPFPRKMTKLDYFLNEDKSIKRVPFLSVAAPLRYFRRKEPVEFEAVELLFRNRVLSFIVILPLKIDGIKNVFKNRTASEVCSLLEEMKLQNVRLYLPKISIESVFESEQGFSRLLFNYLAVFANPIHEEMIKSSSPYIVRHKLTAKFSLQDEDVAVTNETVNCLEVVVNRPFIIIVKDNLYDSFLYLVRVASTESC